MEKITKDTIIADILSMDKKTARIFLQYGMQCLGCPSSAGESVDEACDVHGIDVNMLLDDLNNCFAK